MGLEEWLVREAFFEEILRRGQACEDLGEEVHSGREEGKCKGLEVTEKALNSDDSEKRSLCLQQIEQGSDWRWGWCAGQDMWGRFMCVCWVTQSCPTLVTPWIVARQAALSMGFPRQEYWSGLRFSPPGDLHDLRIEPVSSASPALASRFFTILPPKV